MKIRNIEYCESEIKNLGFRFDDSDGKYKIGMKTFICTINSWNGLIVIIPKEEKYFDINTFSQEVIKLIISFNNFTLLEED